MSAVLTAFGLAVLYSASAFVADERSLDQSCYFLIRQLEWRGRRHRSCSPSPPSSTPRSSAIGRGRSCGSRSRRWLAVLVLPGSIAPTIHGSRRFLFGASFQPSEFGKLAVVVWVLDADREEGRKSHADSRKGLVPFLVVIGVLDVLAALEPDLSVAMLFTLLMALLLFVGGARMSHFIALGAMCLPLTF